MSSISGLSSNSNFGLIMFPDQHVSCRNGPIGPFREAKRACLGNVAGACVPAYKTTRTNGFGATQPTPNQRLRGYAIRFSDSLARGLALLRSLHLSRTRRRRSRPPSGALRGRLLPSL